MSNLNLHIKIALGYFSIAALLGAVLRVFPLIEIPINYKFFIHTHSHIALLGWVYLALTTIIYKFFAQAPHIDRKYKRIFWFTQLTLVGMLLTFPFTGYAMFSIIFSTLFLFASYWFFWFMTSHVKPELKSTNSFKCIKISLWYLTLSSLGPWALGGIMNTLGAESAWYRIAIYFYLHFLYNGFMMMALIGLFMYLLQKRQIIMPQHSFKKFFWSINSAIFLSFFLSTLFAQPLLLFNALGGIGAILQLVAFGMFIKFLFQSKEKTMSLFSPFQKMLLQTVVILLCIKMLLQILSTLPYFANLAVTIMDFTIGYLHWTFLGVVTIFLFFFLDYFGFLKISKKGYFLYATGFILTELLIFYKGIAAWQGFSIFDGYFEILAVSSFLIAISLLVLFFENLGPKSKHDD